MARAWRDLLCTVTYTFLILASNPCYLCDLTSWIFHGNGLGIQQTCFCCWWNHHWIVWSCGRNCSVSADSDMYNHSKIFLKQHPCVFLYCCSWCRFELQFMFACMCRVCCCQTCWTCWIAFCRKRSCGPCVASAFSVCSVKRNIFVSMIELSNISINNTELWNIFVNMIELWNISEDIMELWKKHNFETSL